MSREDASALQQQAIAGENTPRMRLEPAGFHPLLACHGGFAARAVRSAIGGEILAYKFGSYF